MKCFTCLTGIIILVSIAGLCLAGIPKMINYQGMLTDNSGTPLSGSYNLTFKIWTDTTGGSSLWDETHAVQVQNGLYNVILGQMTALNLPFDQQYWLEVQVGDETMPRIRFTSVGYAYHAQNADTAEYARGGGETDSPWVFRITDGSDTTIITGSSRWGIARYGSTLYGNADSTHVNLGVFSVTGTSGQDYKYCTVGGGYHNTSGGYCATIAGGKENAAKGNSANVGGGYQDTANGDYATVGGGYRNIASAIYATIAGGFYNTVRGERATIGGGYDNAADTGYATIGGGRENQVSGIYGIVGGGYHNVTSGQSATVGGGSYNAANTNYATVAGGYHNTASGERATVGGGYYNAADTDYAAIGGGRENTASGYCATVVGGYSNIASGSYSFAAGDRANANHNGAFVWADAIGGVFASTGNNQFLIRASGGVGIGTNSPDERLHVENSDGDNSIKIRSATSCTSSVKLYEGSDYGFELAYAGSNDQLNLWSRKFSGNEAIRMTWLKNGNVGIGTTSPGTKLAVYGLTSTSSYNYVKVNTATGDFYYQSSSKRYKENIQPLQDDFDKILQVEPKSFVDKTSGQREIGCIAEEFDGMGLNNLVIYNKDGQPDGLKYELVSLYLLEVVKAQQERISSLEKQMAEMKSKQ